jgi:hypothetical protein
MMTATPALQPSSPSIRFSALVMDTIQRVVRIQESHSGKKNTERVKGSVTFSMRKSWAMAMAAARIWQSSLNDALRFQRSSKTPTIRISRLPMKTPSRRPWIDRASSNRIIARARPT